MRKLAPISTLFLSSLLALLVALLVSAGHARASASYHHSLSVYSTYPSNALLRQCEALKKNKGLEKNNSEQCIEDAIPVEHFLVALKNSNAFARLMPFEDGGDYELLIANMGHTDGQYAEFILQWRGLEISSLQFSYTNQQVSTNQAASVLVDMWLEKVRKDNVFSNVFLFSAVQASDYTQELNVPDKVGDFTKLETQLYDDPFNGAITRYTHSQFEDALIDVTVYPFMEALSVEDGELLYAQLREDVARAEKTAQSQALTLSQPSPASPYAASSDVVGWRVGLKAESETAPTLYASTYVFRRGDKIVKVSTTFPVQFSDPIADELIASISVPTESVLMKNIRQLLQQSTQGD